MNTHELTYIALASLDPFARVRTQSVSPLAKLVKANPALEAEQLERAKAQLETATRRKRILERVLKVEPNKVLTSIAAGVLQFIRDRMDSHPNPRGVKPHDGLWIIQNMSNNLCNLAASEVVRRKRNSRLDVGISSVFANIKDETGMWIGEEDGSPEPDNLGDNEPRNNTNPFVQSDDPVLDFTDWFEEIQPYLSAMAAEATSPSDTRDPDGNPEWIPSLYGHRAYYRQNNGRSTIIVETIEDVIAERVKRIERTQAVAKDFNAGGVDWTV